MVIKGLTSFSDALSGFEAGGGGDPLHDVLDSALGRCKQELVSALKERKDTPAGDTDTIHHFNVCWFIVIVHWTMW